MLSVLGLVAAGSAQESGVDFLSRIESNSDVARQIGLAKLSMNERAALNELLNLVARSASQRIENSSSCSGGAAATEARCAFTGW